MLKRVGGTILLCVLAVGLLMAIPATEPAVAQGGVIWSEPFNVSDSPTGSAHPAIVADAYGHVHVFWSEDMGGATTAAHENPEPGNTILYRRWDGHSWTETRDIIAVSGDPLADFVAATVDDTNRLHLVWTGLTNLYYSSALAVEADSVHAWSAPQIISAESARSAFESDVAVDSQGAVHIVYATKGSAAGVFHIAAATGSNGWSLPVQISDRLRPNEVAFGHVRLVIDSSDRLHAAWGTVNTNGMGQGVYYARRERAGGGWDAPVLVQDATTDTGFIGYPSLVALGRDEMLLIHVDPSAIGRAERTSTDGGRTWSEAHTILTSMEGVNGFLIPLADGRGDLHLVINMRPTADQRVGIYYAPRAGLDWAPITPVAVERPSGSSAHHTDATVRLGKEIHVAWTQLSGGEIWYARGEILGVTEDPSLPTPTPVVATSTAVASTVMVSDAEPTATHSAAALTGTPPPSPSSSSLPLLLGGLASALVVLAAVARARLRSR